MESIFTGVMSALFVSGLMYVGYHMRKIHEIINSRTDVMTKRISTLEEQASGLRSEIERLQR
jgi:chaperonin cofactor prefoldin